MGKKNKAILLVLFVLFFVVSAQAAPSPNSYQHQHIYKYLLTQKVDQKLASQITKTVINQDLIEPELIIAIIQVESSFNPKIVGKSGERGLMQISDVALREVVRFNSDISYAPEKLFDVEYNILVGCRYLMISYLRAEKYLPAGYNKTCLWASAVMAYKDGFRWGPKTFFYARKVMSIYRKLKNAT